MTTRGSGGRSSATAGFVVAALLGAVHAAFGFYWAAGGSFLLWSVGDRLVEFFQGTEWLLVPIGAVKLFGAFAPLTLAGRERRARRLTRLTCWLGALLLIGWGGMNTAVANLVLVGVVGDGATLDRDGMIGHAYLWDPLFLAWGVALVTGLLRSSGTPAGRPAPGRLRIRARTLR
jgi:hypothetical protein